jgi:outer membrane protein TolC
MSDGVEFEVRRAYYSLEEAGLRIAAASGSVDEGEESLRIIRRRFEAGLARSIDVLDAETALTRARTNRANALYDYNVSLVKLRLAAGILSPSDYGEDDDK